MSWVRLALPQLLDSLVELLDLLVGFVELLDMVPMHRLILSVFTIDPGLFIALGHGNWVIVASAMRFDYFWR